MHKRVLILLNYLRQIVKFIYKNYKMLDQQQKRNIFISKSEYQLKEIDFNCKEVISLSKHLNTLSNDIANSQVNCRKIQIYKSQIRQKLRQFSSNIDQVYKILDKKISIILNQLKKVEPKTQKSASILVCAKCNKQFNTKLTEETEKTSSQGERLFSQTLNPRINYLQSKIADYQANQIKLKTKITELKGKNQSLLEQFNRLSTASNNKINELTSRISKDSFSSDSDPFSYSPKKPSLTTKKSKQSNTPTKPKTSLQPYFETDQFSNLNSHEGSYSSDAFYKQEEGNRMFKFGCMPSNPAKSNQNPLRVSNISDQYQGLDRNDKNRRFDLLLNKLRDSQQDSTDESHCEEMRIVPEETGSVFAQNIVRRYQI